jgi:hypothetical protein
VLKKAGIVVGAATAALLALSPLAFASDTNNNGESSHGIFNVADNNGAIAGQACNNDVPIQGGVLQGQVPVKDVTGALSGAIALLAPAESTLEQATDNSDSCGDNSATAGDTNDQDVD